MTTAASFVVPFFVFPALAPDIVTYEEIILTFALVESAAVDLGLFLVFRGIVSLLPPVPPWSRAGPLLILVGAILTVAAFVVELAVSPFLYSSPQGSGISILYLGAAVVGFGARVLVGLGTLVAFVAIAFGILSRSKGPLMPARP